MHPFIATSSLPDRELYHPAGHFMDSASFFWAVPIPIFHLHVHQCLPLGMCGVVFSFPGRQRVTELRHPVHQLYFRIGWRRQWARV